MPIAIGVSLWLLHQGKKRALPFALFAVALAVALFVIFIQLPIDSSRNLFFNDPEPEIPRHDVGLASPCPGAVARIAIHCWRERANDRLVRGCLDGAGFFLATLLMPYAQDPYERTRWWRISVTLVGYLVLLILLLKLAPPRCWSACGRKASWRS